MGHKEKILAIGGPLAIAGLAAFAYLDKKNKPIMQDLAMRAMRVIEPGQTCTVLHTETSITNQVTKVVFENTSPHSGDYDQLIVETNGRQEGFVIEASDPNIPEWLQSPRRMISDYMGDMLFPSMGPRMTFAMKSEEINEAMQAQSWECTQNNRP